MNKDLLSKCKSIEKSYVIENTIDYNTLVTELNKNKHYQTEVQRFNAMSYFIDKGIIILEHDKVSAKNFNDIEKAYLKNLVYEARRSHLLIDPILIESYFPNSKVPAAIRHVSECGYLMTDSNLELDDTEEDYMNNENEDDDDRYVYDEESNNNNVILDDSVRTYLKDIGQYPLLSAEDEFALAEKAYNGDEEAKTALVNHNLRLVVSIAKHYIYHGLSFMDVVQHGNLGLLTAVSKFDPYLGNKLSTYATWWIRQSILRGIGTDCRFIRMPIHASEQAAKNRKSKMALYSILGREPSEQELVDYINENKLYVSSVHNMTIETLRMYESFYDNRNIASLQTPIHEDEHGEETVLGDMLAAAEPSPEEEAINQNTHDVLVNVMNEVLNERERVVIYKRMGFNGDRIWTLEEIAGLYGLTRERIRQIESKAIYKLRRSRSARAALASLLDHEIPIPGTWKASYR